MLAALAVCGALVVTTLVIYALGQRAGMYASLVLVPLFVVICFAYKFHLGKLRANSSHASKLADLYLSTVEALTMAIDAKDQINHGRVRRVQAYAVGLANAVGYNHEGEIEGLRAAALLHDIGKLAVPEYILNKPGRLTAAEFAKMSAHPTIAAEILSNVEFPYPVVPLVLHHHEKWDGTGYPLGLRGEDIPLGARILAIADCYEALRSDRPYRKGFSKEKSIEIMKREAGRTFDPRLMGAFLSVVGNIEKRLAEVEAHEEQSDDHGHSFELAAPRKKSRRISSVYQNIAAAHKEVLSLYEISQTLGSTLNLTEVLAIIASRIGNIVDFTSCVIYLYDQEKKLLSAAHVIGEDAEALLSLNIPLGSGISGQVAENREPAINRDPQPDLCYASRSGLERYRKSLIFPLAQKEKILGVLALYSVNDTPYGNDQIRLTELVSKHASTALHNALTFEETQESALTDRLTGLPNSRYMYSFFEQELMKAEMHNYPVTLLMMDLDGFKKVNDQYGHHIGDDLLKEIARVLSQQIRREDILVRYAGDEFVGVLIGTTSEQTDEVIARIQSAVEAFEIEVRPGKAVSVGVSIGKAVFPNDGTTLEELMMIADANMYRNKEERKEALLPAPAAVVSFPVRAVSI